MSTSVFYIYIQILRILNLPGHKLLEPISKFAFEPRDAIFREKREVEGEEYQDISSPNRSVTAKNRVLCEPEWNFEIGSKLVVRAPTH